MISVPRFPSPVEVLASLVVMVATYVAILAVTYAAFEYFILGMFFPPSLSPPVVAAVVWLSIALSGAGVFWGWIRRRKYSVLTMDEASARKDLAPVLRALGDAGVRGARIVLVEENQPVVFPFGVFRRYLVVTTGALRLGEEEAYALALHAAYRLPTIWIHTLTARYVGHLRQELRRLTSTPEGRERWARGNPTLSDVLYDFLETCNAPIRVAVFGIFWVLLTPVAYVANRSAARRADRFVAGRVGWPYVRALLYAYRLSDERVPFTAVVTHFDAPSALVHYLALRKGEETCLRSMRWEACAPGRWRIRIYRPHPPLGERAYHVLRTAGEQVPACPRSMKHVKAALWELVYGISVYVAAFSIIPNPYTGWIALPLWYFLSAQRFAKARKYSSLKDALNDTSFPPDLYGAVRFPKRANIKRAPELVPDVSSKLAEDYVLFSEDGLPILADIWRKPVCGGAFVRRPEPRLYQGTPHDDILAEPGFLAIFIGAYAFLNVFFLPTAFTSTAFAIVFFLLLFGTSAANKGQSELYAAATSCAREAKG